MMNFTQYKLVDVDIDNNGIFKYILIKLKFPQQDGHIEEQTIVRGYGDCSYHADIYDKFKSHVNDLKRQRLIAPTGMEVLGGGRIEHSPDEKFIKVYGYSQGYGKADHEETVKILKTKYPDYTITWSDGGY